MAKKGNTRKTGKEQYYTNSEIAKVCVDVAMEFVGDDLLLEPCGGTGEFVKRFELTGNNFSAFDIEPKYKYVELGNFFEVDYIDGGPFSVITNPPFGRMNSLSVKFFNHAANLGANYIGFLIPISWRKWSTVNRLDQNYHLVKDIDLPNEHLFYGNDVDTTKPNILRCVFQVWERRDTKRDKIKVKDNGFIIKTKPEEADVQIAMQGWSTGKVTTDFDKTLNKNGYSYFKIQNREVLSSLREFYRDGSYEQFTKNCAYVKSISLMEINYLLNEKFRIK